MTWNYTVSTSTLWASFDYGTVEASTREVAITKAKSALKDKFARANKALASNPDTRGFSINYNNDQIEVTPADETN